MPTREEIEKYAAGWKAREEKKQKKLEQKKTDALDKAHQIAVLLQKKYQAEQVFLFGSLTEDKFWAHSDIDLAVWGVSAAHFLEAYWAASRIALPFELDLLPAEDLPVKMRKKIIERGQKL